jgi:hypothetical protein
LQLFPKPIDPLAIFSVVLFATLILVSGGWTARDYFLRWARIPALGKTFETDIQLAAVEAASILGNAAQSEPVVLSADLFSQPQLLFALGPVRFEDLALARDKLLAQGLENLRFLFDRNFTPVRSSVLLWREADQVKSVWMPSLAIPIDESISQPTDSYLYPQPILWPSHQLGWPVVLTGRLPSDARFCFDEIHYPLDVTFANGLHLAGYDLTPVSSAPGDSSTRFTLTLFWQVRDANGSSVEQIVPEEEWRQGDYTIVAQLVNSQGVAQVSRSSLNTTYVPNREYVDSRIIKDVHVFSLPPDMASGRGRFEVGLHGQDGDQEGGEAGWVPVLGEQGQPIAEQAVLGSVFIGGEVPQASLAGMEAIGAQFDEQSDAFRARECLEQARNWPFHDRDQPYVTRVAMWAQIAPFSFLSRIGTGVRLTDRDSEFESAIAGVRYPLDTSFANGMKLIAYDLTPDIVDPDSQDSLRLRLFWQADSSEADPGGPFPAPWMMEDFDAFVHLTDGEAVWQTANRPMGDKYLLQNGGVVEQAYDLLVPLEMPRGHAFIELGLYYYGGEQPIHSYDRIPIVDGLGQPVADRVTLGGLLVGEPTETLEAFDTDPLSAQFVDSIELLGWRAQADPSDPGQIQVVLDWQALDRPIADYTAFVHLLNGQQEIVSQHDQPPGGLERPSHLWAPGEMFRSRFTLERPTDTEADELTLRIGLYEPISGNQLPLEKIVEDWAGKPGDTYLLIPLNARSPA